jgi:DNA-binding NtrC family response regulator
VTSFPTLVDLIGPSAPAERARAIFRRAATSHDPVLIVAEAGFDIPAVARAIHDASARFEGPFLVVDCGHPDSISLEQQVFGRLAFEGTLALVNLHELPLPLQARLARTLRDGQIETAASGDGIAFDVRVIAGVMSDAEGAIQEGTLRRDLYARFNVRLELPPLRQRAADIPMLIGCLVGEAAAAARVPIPTFSREALTLLAALPWRHNVHELREILAVLVRAVVGGAVRLEDVLDHVALEPVVWGEGSATNLREARLSFERHFIAKVLNRHRGRMDDAARSLGMQRTNLYRKVRQLGIGLPRTR